MVNMVLALIVTKAAKPRIHIAVSGFVGIYLPYAIRRPAFSRHLQTLLFTVYLRFWGNSIGTVDESAGQPLFF